MSICWVTPTIQTPHPRDSHPRIKCGASFAGMTLEFQPDFFDSEADLWNNLVLVCLEIYGGEKKTDERKQAG